MNPTIEATRRLLRRVAILHGIGGDEIEDLVPCARLVRYPKGTTIYRKGEAADSMLVVVSGQVRILSCAPDGGEVLLNTIHPGDVVGEIGLIDGGPRTADVVAFLETDALVLDRRNFVPFLEEHGRVGMELLRVLCQRIRQTTAFVEDAVLLDLPTRLIHRLHALAERHGRPRGPGVLIEHGLSQQDLAESIGVSRVSVNKQLTTWRAAGLIDYGRGFVLIRDPIMLEPPIG